MHPALASAVFRPVIARWIAHSRSSWRTLRVPAGIPLSRAHGPDPDRILLVGTGIAVGYGAASHDLALAGHLARQVSDLTGRGARVEVLAEQSLVFDSTLGSLSISMLRELDVIVATPDTLDAQLLTTVAQWRTNLDTLIVDFETRAPASLKLLFVGIPEVSSLHAVPPMLGWLGDRAARALNRELEAACAEHASTIFLPFLPAPAGEMIGSSLVYGQWASLLAPSVAGILDEHHRVAS